jgi:hypothetical protein
MGPLLFPAVLSNFKDGIRRRLGSASGPFYQKKQGGSIGVERGRGGEDEKKAGPTPCLFIISMRI